MIDIQLLREKMLLLAVSRNALACAAGIPDSAMRRLEEGHVPDYMTVGQIRSIELALDMPSLFRVQDHQKEGGSSGAVSALISTIADSGRRGISLSQLRARLNLDEKALANLLEEARGKLSPLGLLLSITQRNTRLIPDPEQSKPPISHNTLNETEASIIAEILNGSLDRRSCSNGKRKVALGSLYKFGLIGDAKHPLRLSKELETSLAFGQPLDT